MPPRIAFITGAAQGMGEAIALRLASDNEEFAIALFDLPAKETQLEGVVSKIKDKGRTAVCFTGDVSLEDNVREAVEKCVTTLGGLDIVCITFVHQRNMAPDQTLR